MPSFLSPDERAPRRGAATTAALVMFALAAAALPARAQSSQAARLDPRWTPWLGCWAADSSAAGAGARQSNVSCVIPLSGSSGVEQVAISRGRITERRRLVADDRPLPFDENGCKGTRTAEWSANGRRVYTRASYTCNIGLVGTSNSVLSLTQSGDWLETETVHAGQGSIEHVDHWRDVGVPAGVPADVAAALESRRLAVRTARASAAVPLSASDVMDALQHADSSTVREWILASGQRFSLSGDDVAALVRANVPRGVLQAMVAWAPQPGAATTPGYDQDAYLKATSGYPAGSSVVVVEPPQNPSPGPMYCTGFTCYPANQYSAFNGYEYAPYIAPPFYPYAFVAPIIVTHRRSPQAEFPHRAGPVGINAFPPPGARPPTRPVVHLPHHP